jgi:hypothetical protein
MKRVFPIFLSMVGCLLLFSQTPPSPAALEQSIKDLSPIGGVSASVTKDLIAARKQVLLQQDVVRGATQLAKTNPAVLPAVRQAQAQLEATQKTAADLSKQAAPAGSAAAVATREEGAHLIQLVSEFNQEMKQQAQSASSWELVFVFAAVGLGFGSTVFSIYNFNKASAVMSALVVVSAGIPKLIPVHQRAVYYRTLKNQSYSLLAGLSIPLELTVSECDDAGRRLQVLEEYVATKYPETSDIDSTTEDLFKDLNAAKTAVAEAH